MICPNCQKEIPDTARACGHCGYWLGGEKPGLSKPNTGQNAQHSLPWVWIALGIVTIALISVIIYLFSNSSGRVDTEATVAAAIAATETARSVAALPGKTPTREPQSTATTISSTDTPVPEPTDIATPKSPNTPKPTNTPRPTPMPTATIDADPLVYDNFNNPEFDGNLNRGLWEYWSDTPHRITQQNGVLIVSNNGKDGSRIAAKKYIDFTFGKPIFFEANLMLDKDNPGKNSNIQIHVQAHLPKNEEWFSECGIGDDGNAYCFDTSWPWVDGQNYDATGKKVGYGSSHKLRIEIDPDTMTFAYFIDGQKVGSHIPVQAEKIKKARFDFYMGIWSASSDACTGYIDDVRIGQVGK